MRKASVIATFDWFFYWMDWYINFLVKIYTAKTIIKKLKEKKELFEAFVLRIHSVWESFIEDLLIDCLNRDTSQYTLFIGAKLPKNMSRNLCKAIVLGLGYLECRRVSDIKSKANKILVPRHNPFRSISRPISDKIDEFYKIRNYLAHYSDASKRILFDMYKKKYKMIRFREPGSFLMALDRKSNRLRFGNYISALIKAGIEMAKFLKIR